MMDKITGVIEAINELLDDNSLPKNVREKLLNIVHHLKQSDELSLKIDRALHDLEGISEDSNLQTYTRTQVWNIVSLLEMAN